MWGRPSAVEYRPADVVSQPLIVQDEIAYRIRKLVALPAALEPAGTLALAFRRGRASDGFADSIEGALNLYNRDWPIWTYQPQYPPAKFIFDDEGRRGEAIDSLIAGGCILSGARVKRSVLFFATTVENYSHIKDSVILPKVSIGRNCRISRAIIDKGTVIPDGMVIGEDPVEDARRFHVTPEGIVLVTSAMLGQNLYARLQNDYDG